MMKTNYTFVLLTAVLLVAMVLPLPAQDNAAADKAATVPFRWQKGDTVMLDSHYTRYLTGERISQWVYKVPHQILQVGTRRAPEGLLLGGIMSWVMPEGVILKGATPREDGSVPVPAQPQDTPVQTPASEPAPEENIPSESTVAEQQPEDQPATEVVPAPAQTENTEEIRQDQPAGSPTATPAKATVTEVTAEPSYTITHQPAKSNYHRFSIGVHGGYANFLPTTTDMINAKGGFDAMLDLQYAYYWTKFGRSVDLGILTGLSFGYSQGGVRAGSAFDETQTVADILYTLKADAVRETDLQLQVELPVMFALVCDNGLFFNAGVRFMLPVYTPFNRTISDPDLTATFLNLSSDNNQVTIPNTVFTGRLEDNQLTHKGKSANQWSLNVMLNVELGYEWTLSSGNSLGLGAVLNYCPRSLYEDRTSDGHIMNVEAPTADGMPAKVTLTTSATEAYATKLGYIDAGVKLVYHFNFPKKFNLEK